MQPKQPIKPGDLCYVKNPHPTSLLNGRIVIAIRTCTENHIRMPDGSRSVKRLASPDWWVKSAIAGDTLPMHGFQLPERPVKECLLYPITPPAGTMETETAKWLEELYEQQI